MVPVFDNLRAFFTNRPPLVVFMICLASFAIALITFAYIVKTKDIHNPDITRDWNTFLEKFSRIDLCFSQNASENVIVNSTGGKVATGDLSPYELYHTLQERFKQIDLYQAITIHKLTTRDVESRSIPEVVSANTGVVTESRGPSYVTAKPLPTSLTKGTQLRNISFVLSVEVVLSKDNSPHFSLAETNFVTIIGGDKLKLNGELADKVMMATFAFPANLSTDTCQTREGGVCQKHLILACVQLQGPASLFPNTPMPDLSEMCHPHVTVGGESPSLRFMVPYLPNTIGKTEVCQQGSHMSTYFSFDESLTVLLSLHDRSIINLRLMRTSYFLFVMIVTFLCFAMIRGRRVKNKIVVIPYVEKVAPT